MPFEPTSSKTSTSTNTDHLKAQELIDFFNITQTRTSYSSIQITLESLLSSMCFSLSYLILQVFVFSYLRRKFEWFYEPLAYKLPDYEFYRKHIRDGIYDKIRSVTGSCLDSCYGYLNGVSGLDLHDGVTIGTLTNTGSLNTSRNVITAKTSMTGQSFKSGVSAKSKFIKRPLKLFTPIGPGFFDWIKCLKLYSIGWYYRLGIDQYFFLRFLNVLLMMFVGLCFVNIPVLIPVNYFGSVLYNNNNSYEVATSYAKSKSIKVNPTSSDVDGEDVNSLDAISTSNIAPSKNNRYLVHFVMAILVILWFHYILVQELKACAKERQFKLVSDCAVKKTRDRLSVMYIANIPDRLNSADKLKQFFDVVPGGVDSVWPIYDYTELNKNVEQYKTYRNKLEELVLDEMKLMIYTQKFRIPKQQLNEPISVTDSLSFTMPLVSKKTDSFQFYTDKLQTLSKLITTYQTKILNQDTSPSLMMRKAFIKFNKPYGTYSAQQLLLSCKPNELTHLQTELQPEDIIWENMIKHNDPYRNQESDNFAMKCRETIIIASSVILILVWVVPVALVGPISQLPYLMVLIPTITWLVGLPSVIKGFIASIVPTLVLGMLTGIALSLFGWLVKRKGSIVSGIGVEISLQRWVFVFMFFHLFIVITLSSGLVVVLENLVYDPVSIPMMVALDFPKASNFFYSFFILRGLTLFGGNLLQFGRFINDVIIGGLVDKTPRQVYLRRVKLPRISWGITYPTFSVYASIGLVYSVISPMILIFCCMNFILDLLSYKIYLSTTNNPRNLSETYGKLYSIALRQLYAGIYSLEIFLIGLFSLVRDDNGVKNCLVLAGLMFVVLCVTVCVHVNINRKYDPLMISFPMELFNELEIAEKHTSPNTEYATACSGSTIYERNLAAAPVVKSDEVELQYQEELKKIKERDLHELRLLYLHPSFKFNPENQFIWIPKDTFGVWMIQKLKLEKVGFRVFIDGCDLEIESAPSAVPITKIVPEDSEGNSNGSYSASNVTSIYHSKNSPTYKKRGLGRLKLKLKLNCSPPDSTLRS